MRLVSSNDTLQYFTALYRGSVCQFLVKQTEIDLLECARNWTRVLEGRVEICKENQYGTACDDRWDELEARIVCRQLQHNSNGM